MTASPAGPVAEQRTGPGAPTASPAESVWGGDQLDLDAYLARTGYTGGLDPTVETLRGLHHAHTAAIPFENLDVALEREVRLDLDSVQRKLVTERRGGYCYEQNSLFAAVLERLGFVFTAHGARVRTAGPTMRPITHVLLRVVVDGEQWLADTRFGGMGPLEPVELPVGTSTCRAAGPSRPPRRRAECACCAHSVRGAGPTCTRSRRIRCIRSISSS